MEDDKPHISIELESIIPNIDYKRITTLDIAKGHRYVIPDELKNSKKNVLGVIEFDGYNNIFKPLLLGKKLFILNKKGNIKI
jgi:hypothetical protein